MKALVRVAEFVRLFLLAVTVGLWLVLTVVGAGTEHVSRFRTGYYGGGVVAEDVEAAP